MCTFRSRVPENVNFVGFRLAKVLHRCAPGPWSDVVVVLLLRYFNRGRGTAYVCAEDSAVTDTTLNSEFANRLRAPATSVTGTAVVPTAECRGDGPRSPSLTMLHMFNPSCKG
jgi:hypothetical protein